MWAQQNAAGNKKLTGTYDEAATPYWLGAGWITFKDWISDTWFQVWEPIQPLYLTFCWKYATIHTNNHIYFIEIIHMGWCRETSHHLLHSKRCQVKWWKNIGKCSAFGKFTDKSIVWWHLLEWSMKRFFVPRCSYMQKCTKHIHFTKPEQLHGIISAKSMNNWIKLCRSISLFGAI